jgi:endonuclease YncB( thermonuclease family)
MNNTLNILLLDIVILLLLQTQAFAQFTVKTKVEYVIDGDTFIAFIHDDKERVRMKCIDAPELKQVFVSSDRVKKAIGIEAKEYLSTILSNSNTITLKCNDGRDKYRRLTCEVFDKNQNSINLQMVKDGYAYAMPSKCFSKAEGMVYLTHQHLAKFSQVGLWRYGVWDESWRWRNH